jgi:hypothetical protein
MQKFQKARYREKALPMKQSLNLYHAVPPLRDYLKERAMPLYPSAKTRTLIAKLIMKHRDEQTVNNL